MGSDEHVGKAAEFYRDEDGTVKVRVDSKGERAMSAPIEPREAIQQIAYEAGLTVSIEG